MVILRRDTPIGTYTMEKSRNAFAVAKSMRHVDLKSMEPYQHQELGPLREVINQRNQRKKFGRVLVACILRPGIGLMRQRPESSSAS